MQLKILAAVLYVAMVVVNGLANALPINGIQTGTVSDNYQNLFAPAGFTFAIWGLIYLLLAIYSIYQFRSKQPEKVLKIINRYFIATSLINIAWIFAWHYDYIALTVILMLLLLIFLIKIADQLRKEKLSDTDRFCIRLPFSVYFGWITVATIANITVFLVSIGWDGFGIPDQIWTIIILLVGSAIGIWRMLKDKNIPYGLVFVWAYIGIIAKHSMASGFAGMYPEVIWTTAICILLFVAIQSLMIFRKK